MKYLHFVSNIPELMVQCSFCQLSSYNSTRDSRILEEARFIFEVLGWLKRMEV